MKQADLPPVVYRLGRRPDPWTWPDWRYAGPDGTFGNRFDDAQGIYRVLYASTHRLATFLEYLAPFRPDPAVLAEYAAIEGAEENQESPRGGEVPIEWVDGRCVGSAALAGDDVELGHHETLAVLRQVLSGRLVHYGVAELDAATIRITTPRALTQEISRQVFEGSADGARRWNGISYMSKYGDDLENWAVFEPAAPTNVGVDVVGPRGLDLASVLVALNGLRLLRWEPRPLRLTRSDTARRPVGATAHQRIAGGLPTQCRDMPAVLFGGGRRGALRPSSGEVPQRDLAEAGRCQPATVVAEGEMFELGRVARHRKVVARPQPPEVDRRILGAGARPRAVRGEGEREERTLPRVLGRRRPRSPPRSPRCSSPTCPRRPCCST